MCRVPPFEMAGIGADRLLVAKVSMIKRVACWVKWSVHSIPKKEEKRFFNDAEGFALRSYGANSIN
jgi:hypothetical protein